MTSQAIHSKIRRYAIIAACAAIGGVAGHFLTNKYILPHAPSFPTKFTVTTGKVLNAERTLTFTRQSVTQNEANGWDATYTGPVFKTAKGLYRCYYVISHGTWEFKSVWGMKNGKRTVVGVKRVNEPHKNDRGGFCTYGNVNNAPTLHHLVTLG